MKLQKIIVVLGPPGSGKGTQCKLLVEKFGYAYFSMGDTLRRYAASDNPLGRKIKELVDKGIIVTDDLAEQVALESWEAYLEKPALILEGYPRTFGQVAVLDRFLAKHEIQDMKILSIQADKQKLLDRLSLRSRAEGRVDDSDKIFVEKRFEEFNDKTAKIINYYRQNGLVTEINGDQPIEDVHKEILDKLGFSI